MCDQAFRNSNRLGSVPLLLILCAKRLEISSPVTQPSASERGVAGKVSKVTLILLKLDFITCFPLRDDVSLS